MQVIKIFVQISLFLLLFRLARDLRFIYRTSIHINDNSNIQHINSKSERMLAISLITSINLTNVI